MYCIVKLASNISMKFRVYLNFKTLLQEIPNCDEYRITGSDQLIKKNDQDITQGEAVVDKPSSGGNGAVPAATVENQRTTLSSGTG